MKKEKIQKTNAMRLLDKANLDYLVHHYPWKEDELDAIHVGHALEKPLGQVFKTLVLVGDKTGVIVAMVPSEASIDFKALARASGNKSVEMIHLKDLEKTTGYIRGGCSPLGMKKAYPLYLASEAQAWETIIFSAGKRGVQIELNLQSLVEIAEAKFVDIIKKS